MIIRHFLKRAGRKSWAVVLVLLLLCCLWFYCTVVRANPLLFRPIEAESATVTALGRGKEFSCPSGTFRVPLGLRWRVLSNTTSVKDESDQQSLVLRLETGTGRNLRHGAIALSTEQVSHHSSFSFVGAGSEPDTLSRSIERPGWSPFYLVFRNQMTSHFGPDLKIQKVETPHLSGYRMVGHEGENGVAVGDFVMCQYLLISSTRVYHFDWLGPAQVCTPELFAKIVGSLTPR